MTTLDNIDQVVYRGGTELTSALSSFVFLAVPVLYLCVAQMEMVNVRDWRRP